MAAYLTLEDVPTTPEPRARHWHVVLTNGESFSVFVHRGRVPAEKIGAQIAHHETVAGITVDDREGQ